MKKIKSFIVFGFFLLNVLHSVLAQNNSLIFEHINYDKNFSQSMISSIAQSKLGFIWIGTDNGLFRYDGYNFYRYFRNKNSKGTISNNHINVIFEDSEQNLWIGTNNGVNFFNKNTDDFTQVDILPIKGGRNYISSFTEDDQGNIWVGTFGGVKRLNKESYLLENISSDSNYEINKSRVLSLFFDKEYGVIVGTSQGIKNFNPENGQEIKLPSVIYQNKDFLKAKIWKVLKESNGDLWFGTETMGAFLYSKSKNTLVQFKHNFKDQNSISSNWVNDIEKLNENTIWLATKDGLNVYNKDKNEFIRYEHDPLNNSSLTDNDINCILKDRHESIWLGTGAGGINFYNKANLNFISIGETVKPNFGLNNPIVNGVVQDNDGNFWIGTYGGGLNLLDFNNHKSSYFYIDLFDKKKTSNLITALVEENRDNLLCGTFNGLFRFHKKSKKFELIPLSNNQEINERPITSILTDEGDIWIGTDGNGLKKVAKNGSIEIYKADNSPNSISDNFVTDIENSKNGLWVGTQDGLNYFDKKLKKFTKVFRTQEGNSISNNSITSLFTDSKNRLWIGTDYDGLSCFDEKSETFLVINKAKGLTDATIKSISQDEEGNIWVSSENFLFKITIKKNNSRLTIDDFDVTSYSSKDGMAVKQFTYNCAVHLNNGDLVFGSTKGLTIFNPDSLIKSPNNTDVVFTKLVVNNKDVKIGEDKEIIDKPIYESPEITLNYDQGYMEVEFSTLNFVNPKNSRYAFKLSNNYREDDWHNLGTQNSINLTDLDSGSYILSVRSSNEENTWNPNVKTLNITVLPPWWRSTWAYLIYFTLFIISSYVVFRFIKMRIQLKKELFLEHVENQRQQELYKMQLNFFTNISHEIRTPLTLISGPVEELLMRFGDNNMIHNNLNVVKRNSDRLLKLVNELLDFSKAEKGYMKINFEKQDIVAFCFEIYDSFKGISVEKNIEYKFVINSNSILVYFDKNQLEKVVYNLLSNAFKFTKKNGKIVFSVESGTKNENEVYIKVKDNGIGIPEQSKNNIFNRFFQVDDRDGIHNMGSGVGLALSKSIVELHKGKLTIVEEKETWANTVFQISLKLGNAHISKSEIIEVSTDEKNNEEDNNVPIKKPVPTLQPENSLQLIDNKLNDSKKTILVAEDNEDVRGFIFNILSEEYNIVEFSNGKDAKEYMKNEIPDLIISDIMMPEIDGLELCNFVKTTESTNHIPVILLTAKASTDNRIEGLSKGADSYISKPFSTKVLKLNITNLLTAKEILRHKYSGNFIIDSDLEKISTPEEIFIKKLMKIIESNMENPEFDVNELVKEIGMSRTILYKKVNTLTNHSVASLIKQIRLKKAADIILNTTYPISEVAFMVGFNDRKHFSREFKKVYKLSPTAYKNNHVEAE